MFPPEVDKDGRRVTAAMAKKFCLGADAWRPGATQGCCVCGGWRWVLREEQLQQLQLSSGWWSLEHQHNSSLQSVLAAKSKSILEWAGQTWDGRGGDTLPSQGPLPWCSCFRPRGLCCSCSAWLLLSFRRCSVPDTYSLPLQRWLLASSEGPAGPADPQPNAAAPSLGMAQLAPGCRACGLVALASLGWTRISTPGALSPALASRWTQGAALRISCISFWIQVRGILRTKIAPPDKASLLSFVSLFPSPLVPTELLWQWMAPAVFTTSKQKGFKVFPSSLKGRWLLPSTN